MYIACGLTPVKDIFSEISELATLIAKTTLRSFNLQSKTFAKRAVWYRQRLFNFQKQFFFLCDSYSNLANEIGGAVC
jgi:hypothetical protein